jgi:hypothetical protein
MTIPVLRGLADETSNLPQLGAVLSQLLGGGNQQMIKSLQAAIAADPSVAENLAQLSRDNPELYGALKLGKFGDAIAKTPAGYKQKKEEQSLQAGDLANKQTQQEYDLGPVKASILKVQQAKGELDLKNLQDQAKGFPGVNFKKAIDDFSKGVQSPDVQAVMSNPDARALFSQMMGYKKQGEMIQAQADRQDKSIQAQFDLQAQREDRQRTKEYVDKGNEFFKKYGVGTPQTWAQYLMDPSTQQTVDDLVKNPKLATDPHSRALLDIGQRLEQDQNLHGVAERTRVVGQVNTMLKDIGSGKYKKEELPAAMQNINQQLDVLGQLGGRQMKVVPESQTATNSTMDYLTQKKYSNKPVLIDATTNQKLDANKLDIIAEQPSSKSFSPQQITQTAQTIGKYKGTISWDDVIKKLKTESPEMYQILKQRGDIPE